MNQQQSDELKSLESTQQLLNDNAAKFAAIPSIVAAKGAMDGHITNLKKYRTTQDADQKGLARGKKELREKTTRELMIVASALVASGTLNGDTQMVDQFNYSESELRDKRDDDLINAADAAIAVATPIIAALTTDTGLTALQLSDLSTDNANLTIANTSPEQAIIDKKVATAKIKEIFPLTRTLKDNLLTPLMRTNFFSSDPDFYLAYIDSLEIIDTGHHFLDMRGILTDAVSGNKIAKAIIRILDRDNANAEVMSLKSGEEGHYQIKQLPTGNFIAQIKHPDYQLKEVNFAKGEDINIKKNFSLDPL